MRYVRQDIIDARENLNRAKAEYHDVIITVVTEMSKMTFDECFQAGLIRLNFPTDSIFRDGYYHL